MARFILLAHRPSAAFLGALQQADIEVRGWEQPQYLFKRRKSDTHCVKLRRGWIDPRNIEFGHLRLSAADPDAAWETAIRLGEQYGIYVNNGGRIIE